MRFGYLDAGEIKTKLQSIIKKENVNITEEALERVITLNKDFRQILNTLQCLHSIKVSSSEDYDPIQPDEINEYLGMPTQEQINKIINILFNSSLQDACNDINNLFRDNHWNLPDLIHSLTEYVVNHPEMGGAQKYYLIEKLSDIEVKLSYSNDAVVQLYALISAFQQSKSLDK